MFRKSRSVDAHARTVDRIGVFRTIAAIRDLLVVGVRRLRVELWPDAHKSVASRILGLERSKKRDPQATFTNPSIALQLSFAGTFTCARPYLC
ncbi:hypothetical protein HYPGJ_30573 [Hyphomicrobium sp. GJ21]|nr:hypothetical protein HYPGJ_30573 [Hyphomicrobium sp. GJ21]